MSESQHVSDPCEAQWNQKFFTFAVSCRHMIRSLDKFCVPHNPCSGLAPQPRLGAAQQGSWHLCSSDFRVLALGFAQIRILGSRIAEDNELCFPVLSGMFGGGMRCPGEASVMSPSALGHPLEAWAGHLVWAPLLPEQGTALPSLGQGAPRTQWGGSPRETQSSEKLKHHCMWDTSQELDIET